jgi:hypothetical protein
MDNDTKQIAIVSTAVAIAVCAFFAMVAVITHVVQNSDIEARRACASMNGDYTIHDECRGRQ